MFRGLSEPSTARAEETSAESGEWVKDHDYRARNIIASDQASILEDNHVPRSE